MDRPEDRAALIELLGRDGQVQRSVDVFRWPVTLGRDLRNTVVIDDPQVAPFHARLVPAAPPAPAEGGEVARATAVQLEVAQTRNGVTLGRRRLAAGQSQALASGTLLQLGNTTLRVRLPGEALAAEMPAPPPAAGLARSLLLALLLFVGMAVEYWLGLDPDAELAEWSLFLLGAPAALLLWCTLWALASKLFQQRFDFVGHLGIAAPRFLLAAALGWAVPLAAATLSWPWLAELGQWASLAVGAWTLWAHARHVMPQFSRGLTVAAFTLFLLSAAIYLSINHRATDRWTTQRYLGTLPLPGWRVGTPVSVEQFIDRGAALRAPLEARVRRAAREESDKAVADELPAPRAGASAPAR